MTPYQKRLTDSILRLAGDLKIRNRAQATIDAYTYHVQRFADFTEKPLDRATPQDVRNFQLHLIEERNLSYSSFNQAVCALRFLYTTTIPRKWPVAMIPFGKRANIKKPVHPHVLRHSYATGLLEAGVDILTISRLLGHASFATTMIYLHVRREHLQSVPSPLDWLPVRQLPRWQDPAQNQPPENPIG